jgi:acetolactate synthase-1/3 small subunit
MKRYTISIFTENFIGLLNRVSIIFTRRHLNIESITASESEVKDVYRYTIVLTTTEEQVLKVVRQLEKIVDVLKAFYHTDEETIFQEIALYKIRTSSLSQSNAEQLVRKHNARVLSLAEDFTVLEKTGYKEDTQAFLEDLASVGVLEFARSGRVAITKPMKELAAYLGELEHLN